MPYKILFSVSKLLIFAAAIVVLIQLAKHMIPVDYTKAFAWSLKQKKFLLPLATLPLLLVAALFVTGSFNMGVMFVAGQGDKAFVVGKTQAKMMCVDPDRPDRGVWEYEYGPFTVQKQRLYPGQRFDVALGQALFVHLPGSPHQMVIPHHVLLYLFLHFLILLFAVLAFLVTTMLLMQYAVDLKVMPRMLEGQAWGALFAEKMGLSFPKALGLLTLVLVGLSVGHAFLDNRFDPLWAEMKGPYESWEREMLSKARPGARLKGRVVHKETFTVPGETPSDARREHFNKQSTLSKDFLAYLVEFKGLIPQHPVHVSITERDGTDRSDAALLGRIEKLDRLSASGKEAEFIVGADLSISPVQ